MTEPYDLPSLATLNDLQAIKDEVALLAASLPRLDSLKDGLNDFQFAAEVMVEGMNTQLAKISGAGRSAGANALAANLRHTIDTVTAVDNSWTPASIDVIELSESITNANTQLQGMTSIWGQLAAAAGGTAAGVVEDQYTTAAQGLMQDIVQKFNALNKSLDDLNQIPVPQGPPTYY